MSFIFFQVDLDDCTFIHSSTASKSNAYSYPGTLNAFDYNKKGSDQNLLTVKVERTINQVTYSFYSPPYSTGEDDLRIRIGFLKSVLVYYNEQNPREYYFEIT